MGGFSRYPGVVCRIVADSSAPPGPPRCRVTAITLTRRPQEASPTCSSPPYGNARAWGRRGKPQSSGTHDPGPCRSFHVKHGSASIRPSPHPDRHRISMGVHSRGDLERQSTRVAPPPPIVRHRPARDVHSTGCNPVRPGNALTTRKTRRSLRRRIHPRCSQPRGAVASCRRRQQQTHPLPSPRPPAIRRSFGPHVEDCVPIRTSPTIHPIHDGGGG